MKIAKLFVLFLSIFLLSEAGYSDTVYLKNGAIYEGDIIDENSQQITIKLNIGDLTIDRKRIMSIRKDKEEVVDTASGDKNILEDLKQKSMKIDSYECETETKFYDNSTIKGTLIFKMPDKMKANYVISSESTGTENLEVVIISDGEVFWMYYPQLNTTYKQVISESNDMGQGYEELSPITFIEQLIESDYKIIGEDVIDGQATYCIERSVTQGNIETDNTSNLKEATKYRLWFRISDGFLMKNVYLSDEDEVVFSTQNRNIETNIEIADKEFKFVVPEDVKVIDFNLLTTYSKLIKGGEF